MEGRLPRKLAAILYADVVGYSRLTGEDEDATHRTLSEDLDIISATIESHHGHVMHYAGDAVLAQFAAGLDALSAAVAIQEKLNIRNQDLPDERRVQFRIGVNLGDVIEDRGDIYGDGVNVAARLESLSEPGGICISESVHTAVGTRLPRDYEYTFMGEQQVKNIAETIRVYRISARSPEALNTSSPEAPELKLPDKPSIAVLPFDNMSGDPEQEYFSDGITEDIITDLSQVSGLFVIARNSTFTFKGKPVHVKEVSRKLGVRYVVEGSVRKAGNRVRVTAQLIDGITSGHVWADRYDRDLEDIFAVQDEISKQIVSKLAVTLTQSEKMRVGARGTSSTEAYECVLHGRVLVWLHKHDASAEARRLFERAIDLDPEFSAAHSWLSFTYAQDYFNQWGDNPHQSLDHALEVAEKAVMLDESEIWAHFAMGVTHLWMKKHDEAIADAQSAIALDSNFAMGYGFLGHVLHYAGQSQESLEPMARMMRLDPYFPDVYLHFLAQSYFSLGLYEDAAEALKKRLVRNPNPDISHVLLAACHAKLGRVEEARSEWKEALKINPNYSLEQKRRILPYKNPEDFQRIVNALGEAGLPN